MGTKLRTPVAWCQHQGLRRSDVFLASFPRSGNHLLRFLLHEIFTGTTADFDTIKQTLPWITSKWRNASRVVPGGGRLISTHERYRREYVKAIYLVRDFRDVVLSDYFAAQQVGVPGYYGIRDLDGYLKFLLHGNRFGSWQDHVHCWLNCPIAKSEQLLVVRFEDLRHSTEDILMRVVNFLGIRADGKRIRAAIENNSLERMRAKEDASQTLPRHKGTEESRFVRKGLVGGWRANLNSTQIQLIQKHAGSALALMGYPLVSLNLTQQSENADPVGDHVDESVFGFSAQR